MEGVIYKITNPKGRIYIGQTINFKLRIQKYKRHDCKNQRKLYNSFNKYGFKNHKIEIIQKCKETDLNNLERYYQDLYSATTRYGLNIRLTKSSDRSGKFSKESIKKMSLAKIGKKRSPEVCQSISKRMKEFCKTRDDKSIDKFKKSNLGRKHTKEHIKKNSMSKKGNTSRKGSTHTEESKLKISNSRKGVLDTEETKQRKRESAIKAWKKRKNE